MQLSGGQLLTAAQGGHSLHIREYIRKLRLSEAAKRLKNEKCRIADAAMVLGFERIDGFTRAFAREFGMTPSEYRLRPVPITLFVPYGVKFKELMEAITAVQQSMDAHIPSVIGYEWDNGNPRIQLEPRGERGYIEMRAVTAK